ncbi:MAG TPA: TIGR02281 family clan AA aspartic protease [Ottowia sp.]|jgi:aspartyl protease family protein|nr:MAG: peptidase A2 [Burkholderiales bacterium 68-10]HMT82124.1 TIGR02281 family clan AA aspartic protease [Ottowia sp.]HOM19334.1 TIGR02281 family clan AA aspartic protease [Ottowia sp.]HPP97707.1 TIGR02281 family clan AA aspartic protease [Ottowia sp.]HQX68367.1 TIGR02281 family clan AA aspartic protease [Ottowia sp.]
MTPRLMLALAALLPVLGWAQSVSLHGLLGRQALLIVDGKPPRAVAPGQTHLGVTVLSTDEDRAVLALAGGQRLTLRVGESPVSVGGAPAPGGSDRVALSADARGHFITPGSINNRPTQFLVDTGASVVAIGQAEADRLGLSYRTGQPVTLRTANGTAPGWALKLATLRIGDVTAYEVDAVVTPSAMPAVLLGNSFLNRFSMRRDGDTMLLVKR